MGCSTYTFMLDLHSKKGQISLPVTQGDTNRELRISFSDGVKPYILGAGSVAMMSIVRPTGTEVQEYCKIEDDGARVVYPFSQYTCSVAGLHTCEVVLINSKGKQIASPRFSIDAAPKLVDGNDVEIPDEDITAIDAIYQAEAQRQAAEAEREVAEVAREARTTAAIAEMNEVKTSIETMRDKGDFDGDDGFSPTVSVVPTASGYEVKITDEQGDKTFHLYNGIAGADGADGAAGISAFHEWNGTTLTMHSAAGTSSADLKGEKGNKGDRGDGIDIVKSFSSVAEMLSGQATDGVPIGKFVVISTGNVDDEENARLYVKTETGYMYLTDLSGAQGIRGEKGDQGERGPQGIQGVQGEKGYTPQKGVDYFTDKDISDIATEAAAKVDLKDINTAIDNLDDAKVPIINTVDGVMQPNISGKTNWNLWDTFVYAYSPNVKENGKLKFDGSPKLWKMSSGWNPDNKNSTEGLTIVLRTIYGTIAAADPIAKNDVTTKQYVDNALGDISSALDELHTYAQSLVNGG